MRPGRLTASTDTGAEGMTTSQTYAATPADPTTTTSSVGDTTRTVVTDATGLQTAESLSVAGRVLTIGSTSGLASRAPTMWTYAIPSAGTTASCWVETGYDTAGRAQMGLSYEFLRNYGYDAASGKLNWEFDPSHEGNGAIDYTYTPAGRISVVSPESWFPTTYAFDAAGDITSAGSSLLGTTTFTYTGAEVVHSVTGTATTTYGYDSLGRRITQSSTSASATYTWATGASQLLGYTHRSRGTTDVVAAYSYDPSGQRTRSVVTSGSVTTTTTYTYEGTQLFKLVATTPSQTTTITYLYNELGHPCALAAQVGTAPVCFAVIATTQRGDVVMISAVETGTATVLGTYGYDEYGNPDPYRPTTPQGDSFVPLAVATAIDTLQPLRYAGYTYDSYSGLYYCSQRYYDPATDRHP